MPHEQEELFFGIAKRGGAHGRAGEIERAKTFALDIERNGNKGFDTEVLVTGVVVIARIGHILNGDKAIRLVHNFAQGLFERKVLAYGQSVSLGMDVLDDVLIPHDTADNAHLHPQ